MKKIAISTLINNIGNFGAYLQAFALQETLKKMGYDVEFIYFDDLKSDYVFKYQRKGLEDSRKYLTIEKEKYISESDDYDAIIVGSDEVWNIKNETFEHHKEYFGYGLNNKRVISYAPCCSGTTAEDLIEYYNGEINFSKFYRLSARDVNTQKLIKDINGKSVPLVVDPTFLIDSYDCYFKNKEKKYSDYILIYGYNFSEEEKNKIIEFATLNNLKIFSMLNKYDWCDYIEGDMIDFIWNIKNSNYVVTNTFHGTVFSIIFEKDFCNFPKNSKIKDIVNRYGLEDRDGYKVEHLQDIFINKIDYKKVNKIKKINVDNSLEYLKKSIES